MKQTAKPTPFNVYQMVTDRIVEQLEKGIIPWQRPWSGLGLEDGGAVNYVSRKPYSLLNQMLLGREGEWLTWKQLKERGGNIKKGAKAGIVVFYTKFTVARRKTENEDGEEQEVTVTSMRDIPVLKYYNVFHIDDCEGVDSKIKKAEQVEPKSSLQPIERAEEVLNGYLSREQGLKFINDKPSNRAYYSPGLDMVQVPMLSQYAIAEEYYSTAFHEFVHSTMAKSRCDRTADNKNSHFGSSDYSREELVAETGSAMLCSVLGIDCEKAFKNSVAYIQGWLRALKGDNKAIVWASSRAEKAARYILGERAQ
jgi:antirestriction protein ArdC